MRTYKPSLRDSAESRPKIIRERTRELTRRGRKTTKITTARKHGTYDRNNNHKSQDYRNGGYGRNYGPPPRGPPPQQRNGAVPMEIDMAQGRGRGCFKCGQPGHVARNCPGQAQRQAMMAGDSPGSKRGGSRGSPRIHRCIASSFGENE